MAGILYICGTPIGNIEDITLRCLRTLKEVDIIASEDTRHTLKLLNYYGIKKTLTSYHQHNKDTKGTKIINMLKEGKNVALVTDAGMPGISDPGEDLIKLCYKENINVTIVPGPTAVTAAVILSGLNSRRYVFEAFLPSNKKQRKDILDILKRETRSIVLYESPHHLLNTLNEIYYYLGNRNVAVIKEITKKYEEVKKGELNNIIDFFKVNQPKGEFVIVIEGINISEIEHEQQILWENITIEKHIQIYVDKGLNSKDAIKQVAKDRGVGKREIYNYINK